MSNKFFEKITGIVVWGIELFTICPDMFRILYEFINLMQRLSDIFILSLLSSSEETEVVDDGEGVEEVFAETVPPSSPSAVESLDHQSSSDDVQQIEQAWQTQRKIFTSSSMNFCASTRPGQRGQLMMESKAKTKAWTFEAKAKAIGL